MNRQERDVLISLRETPYVNQRILSDRCGHSLGIVNKSIKNLIQNDYLDKNIQLTDKAKEMFKKRTPRNAIILAAGFGMRMVPINMETPKALLEVNGEPLIERIIKQLHDVNIHEIYVVVGFMKEQFEYLMDKYGVELLVNIEYGRKNNLHSLKKALPYLSNSYIVPCDLWCEQNPFRKQELYSWYMVNDRIVADSTVRINRKMELVSVPKSYSGNGMIGIAYLLEEEAAFVRMKIMEYCQLDRYDHEFWETTLYDKDRMIVQGRIVLADEVVEINTYEQLREIDKHSNHLKSNAIDIIAQALGVAQKEIVDIKVLKKGMTNRSFLFTCSGKKYIMRIPGEGTDQLINRREEAAVYQAISGHKICDEICYMNPSNGFKITEFLEGARTCDSMNIDDVKICMEKLRELHELKLTVDHEFDLFTQILFYESLWGGRVSIYRDYEKTKENIFSLREYIDAHVTEKCLTHIDAVPDNFLIIDNIEGHKEIRLIDWEYAGMQDPHVDLAMFCIYSMYDRYHIDCLIDAYFVEGATHETRIKIYCYIAVCGLLWSNWCEYKRNLGVEFGEYSLRQYRYAKEYYKIVKQELEGRLFE